jgi:tetratricopeptide (TPR) repeat protein
MNLSISSASAANPPTTEASGPPTPARPAPGTTPGHVKRWRTRLLGTAIGLSCLGIIAAVAVPRMRAWYHLRAARAELQKYHNLQAIEHLQICHKIWHDDAEVLLLIARTARRAGSHADAELALEQYQAQRGCDDAAALERTLLRAERGEMDQVTGVCKLWIEQGHPDTSFIFEALAHGYLHAYRLGEVRLCLERWRKDQPTNPQSYFIEGELHDCEGAATDAIRAYEHALQLDPEHDEARLKLTATLLLERRAFVDALPHLEYLRPRYPANLEVRVRLATCRAVLGDPQEGVQMLDEVLRQHPHYPLALAERGKIAVANGEYAAAELWLREAVKLNPGDHSARYALVQCLERAGKESDAQEEQRQIKKLEADLRKLSHIATHQMSQNPNDPALHYELGSILLRNGFEEPGLHWLNSAIKLEPGFAPAHQELADFYKRIGNAAQADHHRRLARAR